MYGITRPVSTWNPIKINWGHFWLLVQDAWRTQNWYDKAHIWFMPTGWRPTDLPDRFPLKKIEDVYNFEKYAPTASPTLIAWIWTQFTFTFVLIFTLFSNLVQIGLPNAIFYGAFITLGIYAYTELMDRNSNVWLWETAKNAIGLGILFYMGNWFGVETPGNWLGYAIGSYFVLATGVTIAFTILDIKKTTPGTGQVLEWA